MYWGLLEGNPGHVYIDGVFSLEPFFDAAAEASINLVARFGTYINAETAAWSLELSAPAPVGNYSLPAKSSVIVNAGYLLRTADIPGDTLYLTGDMKATTSVELIYESSGQVISLVFNDLFLPTG